MESMSDDSQNDFYSDGIIDPDRIFNYPAISSKGFPCPPKKRKQPEKVKKSGLKLRGMKSYEVRRILDTEVLKFSEDNGLVASSATCTCGKPMILTVERGKNKEGNWKCRKKEDGIVCSAMQSVRKGTWFEGSKLSISEILWIAYMWVYEYSYNSLMHECDHTCHTLVDWLSSCRDVCQAIMECKSDQLGGPGKFVEIFDCPAGVESNGVWVFCALEQLSSKMALVFVKDRRSGSLVNIFNEYILPGSTILSNVWGCFEILTVEDFTYLVCIRSLTFYDTVDKVEVSDFSMMEVLTARPPALNKWTKYRYGATFCETIYRKSLLFSDDAYLTFLKDVAKIYTPVTQYSKPLKT